MIKPHMNKKNNTIYNKGLPRGAKRGNPSKYFKKITFCKKFCQKSANFAKIFKKRLSPATYGF